MANLIDLSRVCFTVGEDEVYIILDKYTALTIRFYPNYHFGFSAYAYTHYREAINEILSLSESLDQISGSVPVRRGALIEALAVAGMYPALSYDPTTYRGLANG